MARIALLFDLDGTLVDSDHLHHAAFAALLAEDGRTLSMAEYKARIMGHPNAAIGPFLFPDDPVRAADAIETKEAAFRASLAASVEPVAGIHALLDWAEAAGAATAVVTNAPRANAEAMLAAAGLAERLTELVIGDELARPKPDPLPYTEAMRRIGATPARAIAFEDSASGLRAARGSDAHVFGVATGLPAADLLQAGAHAVIADFTAPALWSHLTQLEAA
jgi:HAD superfamily hydrolase (TIGR01509 family)